MSILNEIEKSKFVYFGFDPSLATPTDIWKAVPILMKSEDAINWHYISYLPQLGNLRDGNITKIGEFYYLLGTLNLYKTKDFVNFTSINIDQIKSNNYTNIWAPEMFQDISNNWHIVYAASSEIFMADYNIQTDTISNPYQLVSVPNASDPTIHIINNKYYLQLCLPTASPTAHIFVSNSYKENYALMENSIFEEAASWYEAPEWLIDNNTVYMYQDKITRYQKGIDDSGYMVYRTADINDLSNWSEEKRVQSACNMRHGGFIKMP